MVKPARGLLEVTLQLGTRQVLAQAYLSRALYPLGFIIRSPCMPSRHEQGTCYTAPWLSADVALPSRCACALVPLR